MIQSEQLRVGDSTEEEVCKIFKKYNYWAHIMQKSTSGQPVDIVACKGGQNFLIDAKHIVYSKKSFTFSRVEDNQSISMDYAYNFAKIKNVGFVIGIGDFERFLFLPYIKYRDCIIKGLKSIKLSELEDFEEVLKREN